ncbi:hypothetical protein COLO4_26588 [Corchorus olitorius]|uniref:Uncharacterized protein n=1 Tax=Corchorus olitorius TaxID=93759 RepID=A0A1R3HW87_9ROSI|nr:hypothetical protein COLO4_26588 [Corchorus olitorius]
MLSRRSQPNGQACSQLLDEWLHFGENELPSLHDCKEMVRDQPFLELLYRRGIADFFPLSWLYKQLISATHHWIAKFTVNQDLKYSTHHRVRLIMNETGYVPHNIEETDAEHGSVWHLESRCRPLHVLVLNARGTANPEFVARFASKTSELNPDIVIITETRSPIFNTLDQGEALQFDSSLTFDSPLNFFGGACFL